MRLRVLAAREQAAIDGRKANCIAAIHVTEQTACRELDFEIARDLHAHKGFYLEAQSKIKITNFSVLKTEIEPNLFGSIGWGDSKHNKYFYGPSAASSSFNNVSYGLRFAFPEESDRFYPIIQLTRFKVIGDKNRFAEYSEGNNQGWLFSVIATYGFLE